MKKIAVEKLATFTGHRDSVYSLEKGPQPHLFFSAAADGMVVSWNLQNPNQGELVAKVSSSVYALHYLPSQEKLCIGQNFEGLHLIDLLSKKETKSTKITSAAIFDMVSWGNILLAATGEGLIIVIDTQTFTVRKHIKASDKSARCISVNPLRKEFAVGYSDNFIRIFDSETFQLKHIIKGHTNSVFTVCYSPDCNFLFTGSRDAHLKIWDATKNYGLHESIVAHMYAINHIAFSPKGDYFLTCSMDKSIKVWDASSYKLLKVIDRARHAGHGTSVNKLLWMDYQEQFVSCSDDRTLSIWQLHLEQPMGI